jgi:hypothetical protein
MGDSLMVLTVIGSIVGIGSIAMIVYVVVWLVMYNRREKRLKCTCGRRAFLYTNSKNEYRIAYAYICECGTKGYVGYDKEEAFYGWELRGNYQAYIQYIAAKHDKFKQYQSGTNVPL